MKSIKWQFLLGILVLSLLTLSACGGKEEPVVQIIPTDTSQPTPSEIPALMPGEPNPDADRILEDSDSSIKAYEHRVLSGDNILNNLYERPFTAQVMEYQPDLDILTVAITSDEAFFYFTITLNGINPTSNVLTGTYGIEFDRSQTGRGDMLVLVKNPAAEWSMENIVVYVNPDATVGGTKPIVAEEGYEEPGYTSTATLEGDKVAWARISLDDPSAVQIAVSLALLDTDEFMWGAWADGGIQDPSLFDYDDHFGPSEAGSPIKTEDDYPIKAVYSVDNTCRLPYGIDDTSGIPGTCLSIATGGGGSHCVCVRLCMTRPGCCEWSCD